MLRSLYRGALGIALPALVIWIAGCGSREADAPRPAQSQMTATPAPASEAPSAIPDATPPAASAATPPAEARTEAPKAPAPEVKLPDVPLPSLPPADQRATVRDLKLKDMAGREISIASLRGKPAMVVFWATWCRPCVMEIPHLVRLQETYAKHGLKIVAISLDGNGMAAVKPFLEKHPEMTYTVIPNGAEASAAFGGIRSIPNSFLLDRQGRVVKQFVGLTPGETLEGWVQAALREKS
jgi:cytochrome c biogenesis protein CcmG/thiol:disulfide interchange protein DsbE